MPFNLRTSSLALALAACVTLPACGGGEPEVAPIQSVADAIEVTNARLVLPPVEGNPGVLYFDIAYSGERGFSITGAEVEGAGSATLHDMTEFNLETTMVDIPAVVMTAGGSESFEPGGLHVMVSDLGEGFAAGGTAAVTLKISGGATYAFDAEIRAAGEER